MEETANINIYKTKVKSSTGYWVNATIFQYDHNHNDIISTVKVKDIRYKQNHLICHDQFYFIAKTP